MTRQNSQTVDAYDSPWKEIVDLYFPQFMQFFFPDLHAKIDWSAGYENLEQELREAVRDAATGKRVVDRLIRVRTLSGKPLHVFIHLEIQNDRDDSFSQRMFIYYYRLYDRYPEAVVSLALLGDDTSNWRPESYEHELWSSQVAFMFQPIKLWDYNERWAELEADSNPFATVVMAHLKTKTTRGVESSRLSWKLRLVRRLYDRGYSRRDVLELFRFIDWVLALPVELEKLFRDEVKKLEKELSMPYVTSVERLGREEGIQQGIQQGLKEGRAELLASLLTRRFQELPTWVHERLRQGGQADLERWASRLFDAQNLEEIFAAD